MSHTKKNIIIGWESPEAIHPGEFLIDILDEFSMSQSELASRIDLSNKAVNEIIQGKNPITKRTAIRLGKVFPISKEYWVNLQSRYESDKARIEEQRALKKEAGLYLKDFIETHKELAKVGFVTKLRNVPANAIHIISELQKFFGVSSLAYVKDESESLRHADVSFRKHARGCPNPYTSEAWLRLGHLKAQRTDVPPFDKNKLRSKLEEMAQLSCESSKVYVQKLEEILHGCGVVLACPPYLKNTHIQGAAMWVGNTPIVMVATNKKSEDRFWFGVFHELGHILKHGKKNRFVNFQDTDVDTKDVDTKEEREANAFVEKSLFADFKEVEQKLSLSTSYLGFKKSIVAIAKERKRSPAILAGRIAYEAGKNNQNLYKEVSPFLKGTVEYCNISPR